MTGDVSPASTASIVGKERRPNIAFLPNAQLGRCSFKKTTRPFVFFTFNLVTIIATTVAIMEFVFLLKFLLLWSYKFLFMRIYFGGDDEVVFGGTANDDLHNNPAP